MTRQNPQTQRRPFSRGLYVHIPFCSSKCGYCDFDSDVFSQQIKEKFLKALQSEIASAPSLEANTLYFGGGTPSLLTVKELLGILNGLRGRFYLADEAEITLEANPDTVSLERAKAWFDMGFNRISLGVQSFDDEDLLLMGRRHTVKATLEALDALRKAGFLNLSLDLILGLPRQTLPKWEKNLRMLFRTNPEHFSAYILDIHEGSAWAKGGVAELVPEDGMVVKMYERLTEVASSHGFAPYEISNFCRPGFESRHNLKYWSDEPYLGLGPSAHSYTLSERFWNIRGTLAYIRSIETMGSAREGSVRISLEDRRHEALIMGLRKTQGIDLQSFLFLYGWDILKEKAQAIDRGIKSGTLEIEGATLRFTPKGTMVSNEILASFL